MIYTTSTRLFIVPSVTTLSMYLCVTTLAKGDQIVSVMCSTFSQRLLVMHLFNWYNHTLLKTNFTKRMCLNVAVSNALPHSSIPTAYSRIPVVLLVPGVLLLLMLLAEPFVRKFRTAWESTRLLRFSWHCPSSF